MTESHNEFEDLSLQHRDFELSPDMEVNKWRLAWMNQCKPPRKRNTRDELMRRYEEERAVQRRKEREEEEEERCDEDEEWETDESEDVEGMEGSWMRMRGFGRRRMRVREYVPWEKGVSV